MVENVGVKFSRSSSSMVKVVTSLALVSSWMVVTHGLLVNINITPNNDRDLPESVLIDFQHINNLTTLLRLQRISHVNATVPLYTVSQDKDGNIQKVKYVNNTTQTVAFYQDIATLANIKLVRALDGQSSIVVQGDFVQNGKKYSITPSSRRKKRHSTEKVNLYRIEPVTVSSLHRRRELSRSRKSSQPSSANRYSKVQSTRNYGRLTRSVTTNLYVDIVAAVDSSVYKIFLNRSPDVQSALQEIREYYTFVFNGIDLCYKSVTWTDYMIDIRLAKIVVFQDVHLFKLNFLTRTKVDADASLDYFDVFITTPIGLDLFAPYDHAMLFVGVQMVTRGDETATDDILGEASLSTVCNTDGNSTSIILDYDTYSETVITAAHELGHSLSAEHDGEGNTCRLRDRYIMAAFNSDETPGTELHPWIFSKCSVDYLTQFIAYLLNTAQGHACLTNQLPSDPELPDTSDRYIGLDYPPEQQCIIRNGVNFNFCGFHKGPDICTQLHCCNASSGVVTSTEPAYMGTVCGIGRMCKQGACVLDQAAPYSDEKCLFGDLRMGCGEYVQRFKGHCYDNTTSHYCCSSCHNAHTGIKGCEYGDQIMNCTESDCNSSNWTAVQGCCETCYRGPALTTQAVTKPSPVTTAHENIRVQRCRNDPEFRFNDLNCVVSVWLSPNLCYNKRVQQSCCSSCSAANIAFIGCEFGDRVPGKCSSVSDCKMYMTECSHIMKRYIRCFEVTDKMNRIGSEMGH
ncbi:A disintegrin and metalloproteinase with thrombospondin motifs 18 [Bulinus truncatus]|nr:A disintegrin and metalloproteinase with thrombospondin motifs 18 [Bulinus truncatus]